MDVQKRVGLFVGVLTCVVILMTIYTTSLMSEDAAAVTGSHSVSKSTSSLLYHQKQTLTLSLLARWPAIVSTVIVLACVVVSVSLLLVFKFRKDEESAGSTTHQEQEEQETSFLVIAAVVSVPIVLILLLLGGFYRFRKNQSPQYLLLPETLHSPEETLTPTDAIESLEPPSSTTPTETVTTNPNSITVNTPPSVLFPLWNKTEDETYGTVAVRRLIMLALWSTRLLKKNPQLAWRLEYQSLEEMCAVFPKFPCQAYDQSKDILETRLAKCERYSGIFTLRKVSNEKELLRVDRLAGSLIEVIAAEKMTLDDFEQLWTVCQALKSYDSSTLEGIDEFLKFYKKHKY